MMKPASRENDIAKPGPLMAGKRGLIMGVANDRSIAWGCARAFRAFGAELAVTYLNDKAKPHVEPLAREIGAPLFMPMDVMADGQLEAVFERIAVEWGELDFLLHSIAFSTKDALGSLTNSIGSFLDSSQESLKNAFNDAPACQE